jgi:Lamin Tail Domain
MRRFGFVMPGALALAMALGLVVASGSSALAAGHRIQIHEIYFDSPGEDTGSNSSLNHEWVQLHNTSGHRITLTHWTLRDKANHVYRFGTYKIKAHGSVTIHTGKGTNTQTNRYWGLSWYVWNNDGDRATLKDNNGNVIDRCSYSGSGSHVFC